MSEADPGRPGPWDDLGRRTLSALVLAAVAILAIWMGGIVFGVFVGLIVGIIFFEMGTMYQSRPFALALIGGVAAFAFAFGPMLAGLTVALVALVLIIAVTPEATRKKVLGPAALVLAAGLTLVSFRDDFGATWMVWLALVVISSDLAGYFVGRMIGGPKFAPRISPKKTWSGTSAGWIAAALVGTAFVVILPAPQRLVWLSMLIAFAGQMGDILESRMKRRQGVKDSSGILPGHGGVYDRMDSMVGAALCLAVLIGLGLIAP